MDNKQRSEELSEMLFEMAKNIRDDVRSARENGNAPEDFIRRVFPEAQALNALTNAFRTVWGVEHPED